MFKKVLSFICGISFIFLPILSSAQTYDPPKEAIESGVRAMEYAYPPLLEHFAKIYKALIRYAQTLENMETFLANPVKYRLSYIILELFGSGIINYEEKVPLLATYLGYDNIEKLELVHIGSSAAPLIKDGNDLIIDNPEANQRAFLLLLKIYEKRAEKNPRLFLA